VALLTTTEVAKRCDVMPHRIRDWRRRGLLLPVSRTGAGHPLYRAEDADRVEASTRHAARDTCGRWSTVAHSGGPTTVSGAR